MTHGSSRFSTSQAKSDAFKSYFASVFRPRSSSTSSTDLPPITSVIDCLETIAVSVEEVFHLLSGLCTTKATGRDGISARLLKECVNELAPSLTELFKMSLDTGKVPSEWKQANVFPILKKDDHQEITSYRPISLFVYNFQNSRTYSTQKRIRIHQAFAPSSSTWFPPTQIFYNPVA